MSYRLIHRMALAAHIAGFAAIGHAAENSAAIPTGTSASTRAAVTNRFDGWLTPDDAFSHAIAEPNGFPARLPLLRIAAVPIASPVRQTAFAPPRRERSRREGSETTASNLNEAAPAFAVNEDGGDRDRSMDEALPRPSSHRSAFIGLAELEHAPPNAIENLPRLVITTFIVLAGCLGTLLVARRWLMKSGLVMESSRNSRLQIIASLTVAPRSQLHIVRMDGRDVLVGVDSRGLQQIQIVPPSFDAVLNTSESQESTPAKADKPGDPRTTPPPRRLFTAA